MLFISAMQNALGSPRQSHFNEKQQNSQEKSQKKAQKIVQQQIDGEKLTTLLQLEALFHERIYQIDHVFRLLEIYSYLVEQFDVNQQTLKEYFLEKMQYLLSRPETISIMKEEDEESNTIQNRLTTIMNASTFDQLRFEEETRFNRPFLQQNSDSNSKMRFSVYKKHQAKEREINLEIQDRKQDQKVDMNQLLQEYDQISKEYEEAIKKQLQDQNTQINQRMQLRKNQKRKKQSNSQEKPRISIVPPIRTTLSKWKLISEIQESVQFMRHSINKIKK